MAATASTTPITMERSREGGAGRRNHGWGVGGVSSLCRLLPGDHQGFLHGDPFAIVIGRDEWAGEVVLGVNVGLTLVTGGSVLCKHTGDILDPSVVVLNAEGAVIPMALDEICAADLAVGSGDLHLEGNAGLGCRGLGGAGRASLCGGGFGLSRVLLCLGGLRNSNGCGHSGLRRFRHLLRRFPGRGSVPRGL